MSMNGKMRFTIMFCIFIQSAIQSNTQLIYFFDVYVFEILQLKHFCIFFTIYDNYIIVVRGQCT